MGTANAWPIGQVVVVTGAGQGIGREIALSFGRRGARVVIASRSADGLSQVAQEITSAGGDVLAVPTDVSDAAAVEALRDAALEWTGKVDVLVNNAGISGKTAVLWEQSETDWDAVMRTNVTGVFLCCRAFLPAMIERQSGNVVIIGSATGKTPLLGRTPYAASKMALVGLVRTLATETGVAGVRVNLVSPGAIAGDRIERVIAAQAEARGVDPQEIRESVLNASALHRLVEPADVADTVLFLASPAAGSVTGVDLNVTAGYGSYA